MKILLLLLFISVQLLSFEPEDPVLYNGRIRPFETYSKILLYQFYHQQSIKNQDVEKYGLNNFIERLHKEGIEPFKEAPLFYLPGRTTRLSYNQAKEIPELKTQIALFENPPGKMGKEIPKNVKIPPKWRLHLENLYYRLPLLQIAILSFLISLPFLLLPYRLSWVGTVSFAFGLVAATAALTLRWLILMRPPVSNMEETILYVPWTAAVCAVGLSLYLKEKWPLFASALLSVILYAILEQKGTGQSLENVQAVLNSPFWLTIHVLMIVGSYGILILSGVLGHLYFLFPQKISKRLIEPMLLSLYIGLALLIPGTLLGGVWAAQSWGRFWDWDPKESWAFITACIYLLVVHAYRFHYIGAIGLAIGSILGLIAVSFTWYGVNYILGTGLHSYGFGEGGQTYYYLYLVAELLFVSGSLLLFKRDTGINAGT
jgi:ABC-type transport system involved in cytochrome c biogenesis permease subunit